MGINLLTIIDMLTMLLALRGPEVVAFFLSIIPLVIVIFLIVKLFQVALDIRKIAADMDEVKEYLRQIAKSEQEKKQ